MGATVRIELEKAMHCPICDHKLDAHTITDNIEAVPENGDYSICLNCVNALVYDINEEGFILRIPTEEEQKLIDSDKNVSKIKQLINKVKDGDQGMP